MISKDIVVNLIASFTKLTLKCYHDTTYAEDRIAYLRDLALCAEWMVLALDGSNIENVISMILDSSSSKYILDYYKEGTWGDEQAKSFAELQSRLKDILAN
jgi:hypothetical protein